VRTVTAIDDCDHDVARPRRHIPCRERADAAWRIFEIRLPVDIRVVGAPLRPAPAVALHVFDVGVLRETRYEGIGLRRRQRTIQHQHVRAQGHHPLMPQRDPRIGREARDARGSRRQRPLSVVPKFDDEARGRSCARRRRLGKRAGGNNRHGERSQRANERFRDHAFPASGATSRPVTV